MTHLEELYHVITFLATKNEKAYIIIEGRAMLFECVERYVTEIDRDGDLNSAAERILDQLHERRVINRGTADTEPPEKP